MVISKKMKTYEAWASEVSLLTGESLTKQAIEERMNPETSAMTKMVLEKKLVESITKSKIKGNEKILSKFGDIMIEDSTTIPLPDELSKVFSGNTSRGKKKSLVKIHALYNFSKNTFSFLDIQDFSRNDQSLSSKALDYLKEGSLLLRDMGFLVLKELKKLLKKGVYVISRKNAQTNVYDLETGEKINLAKELRKRHFIDKEVLVGKKEQIEMRLVAIPLPAGQANEKRRKARKDRDKRLNHNKEYYELLGYAIFITNVPLTMCSAIEIGQLYGLRWQIEIIFKSWKSCFSFEKLMPTECNNPERIYCMIYLFLLFIILFHVLWYKAIYGKSKNQEDLLKLSLLKMANFFIQHFYVLLFQGSDKKIIEKIKLECRYDTRKDRENMMEKYQKLAS